MIFIILVLLNLSFFFLVLNFGSFQIALRLLLISSWVLKQIQVIHHCPANAGTFASYKHSNSLQESMNGPVKLGQVGLQKLSNEFLRLAVRG